MAYGIIDKCNGCGACKAICPTDAISGKKKEIHHIDPEKCIDCGTCGKICPQGAIFDPFGYIPQRVKKSLWEKPIFDLDKCMACLICIDACPTGALSSGGNHLNDAHAYPKLRSPKVCIGCCFCADECPVGAIEMTSKMNE